MIDYDPHWGLKGLTGDEILSVQKFEFAKVLVANKESSSD